MILNCYWLVVKITRSSKLCNTSLCFCNLFVDMCDVFHNLIGSLSALSFYSQFHGLINSVDLQSLLWHFVHTNKSAPELP